MKTKKGANHNLQPVSKYSDTFLLFLVLLLLRKIQSDLPGSPQYTDGDPDAPLQILSGDVSTYKSYFDFGFSGLHAIVKEDVLFKLFHTSCEAK